MNMFHDVWFWLFAVETLGLVTVGVLIGWATARLRTKPRNCGRGR